MPKLSQALALIIIGLVLWFGWLHLGPQKPDMGPLRQQMANEASVAIADDLLHIGSEVGTLILLQIGNDPSSYATDALHETLELRGVYDVLDNTFLTKLRRLLNMREPEVVDAIEAAQLVANRGADAALIAEIHDLRSASDGGTIDIEYKLISSSGETLYQGRYSQSDSGDDVAAAVPGSDQELNLRDWTGRLLAWLVVLLLLPVVTIGFIRTMVRKKSNQANGLVMLVYSVVGMALAYFALLSQLSGGWLLIAFFGTTVISVSYIVWVASLATKLEE